jgi:pimeloyl-ACP methyl ester carboxylesterase
MKKRVRFLAGMLGAFAFVTLGALAVRGARYRPNTEIPPGLLGHHVQVGGIALRVLQRGSGRDILLIHGSPGCIEDWSPLIDELAGSFRVTAFDRVGHGYSGDPGSYSLAYNADTALGLIAALGLQHVIVVGHSYGGAMALALAVRAPAVIDAYVTVDGGAYRPPRPPDPIFALLAVPWIGTRMAPARIRAGTLEQFAGHAPPAGFIELRTQIFGVPKVVHSIAMEWRGAAAWLAAQSPHYRKIRRPLHILGQGDDPYRRATAQRLHREVPGSSLQLFAGVGHYLQFEKTREVLAVIRSAAGAPLH